MKTFKQVIEDMSLAPKGKGREAAKKLYASQEVDKEDEVETEGLSPALKRARRLKRMNTNLQKTMAKYGAASKAGIDPSRVHQRRTQLTIKKG